MNLKSFSTLFSKGSNLFEQMRSKWQNVSDLSFEDVKKQFGELNEDEWREFVEKCGDEWSEIVDAWRKGKESLVVSWKELQEAWAINERIMEIRVDKLDIPMVIKYCKENRVSGAKSIALIVGAKTETGRQKVYLAYLNENDELLDVSQNIYMIFRCKEIDQEILNSVNSDNIVILK